MTAMAIDDLVGSAALCRRPHANRLELALARDVRLEAIQILVLVLEAQGVSVRELARAHLFGIELEHHLAALALGFKPRDRLDVARAHFLGQRVRHRIDAAGWKNRTD